MYGSRSAYRWWSLYCLLVDYDKYSDNVTASATPTSGFKKKNIAFVFLFGSTFGKGGSKHKTNTCLTLQYAPEPILKSDTMTKRYPGDKLHGQMRKSAKSFSQSKLGGKRKQRKIKRRSRRWFYTGRLSVVSWKVSSFASTSLFLNEILFSSISMYLWTGVVGEA